MKLFLLILIIVLSQLFSCKQKVAQKLKDGEALKVLNEIIKDDSLKVDTICSFPSEIKFDEELANNFSDFEKNFIIQQIEQNKGRLFKKREIKYFNIKTNSFKETEIDSTCVEGGVYNISYPLLTRNRNYALISIKYTCNCPFGSEFGIYLYKRTNSKWKRIKTLQGWISLLNKISKDKSIS